MEILFLALSLYLLYRLVKLYVFLRRDHKRFEDACWQRRQDEAEFNEKWKKEFGMTFDEWRGERT